MIRRFFLRWEKLILTFFGIEDGLVADDANRLMSLMSSSLSSNRDNVVSVRLFVGLLSGMSRGSLAGLVVGGFSLSGLNGPSSNNEMPPVGFLLPLSVKKINREID